MKTRGNVPQVTCPQVFRFASVGCEKMAKVLLPPMPVELVKASARKCILIDLEPGKVTARARQVLNLLVTGSSNKQIASQRNLSPDTFNKLGAWSRRNWLRT